MNTRGSTIVEFALWVPVITALLGSIVDLSWMISGQHVLAQAVRDGARYAGSITSTDTDLATAARDHTIQILNDNDKPCGSGCTVTATWSQTPDTGYWIITVELYYPLDSLTGMVPVPDQAHHVYSMVTRRQE